MTSGSVSIESILHTVSHGAAAEAWDSEHVHFALPPGIGLHVGDIEGGSNTPSLVRQVLSWRSRDAEHGMISMKYS